MCASLCAFAHLILSPSYMLNPDKVIEVTEDQYEYALSVLPPFYGSSADLPDGLGTCVQLIQISEPCDIVDGRQTYSTYAHVQNESGEDKYYYLGEHPRSWEGLKEQASRVRDHSRKVYKLATNSNPIGW